MDPEFLRQASERFESDLEALKRDKMFPPTADESYRADLAVADLLSRAHFAPRAEFSHHLQKQFYARLETETSPSTILERSNMMRNRLIRTFATAALAGVIVLGVIFVAVPVVVAQGTELIARFVEVKSPLVPLTQVEGLAPDSGQPPPEVSEQQPVQAPAPEGQAPDAQAPEAQAPEAKAPAAIPTPFSLPEGKPTPTLPEVPSSPELISLKQAQSKVDFKIRVPSWLPEGYKLKGVAKQPELPKGKGKAPEIGQPPALPNGVPPPPGLPEGGLPSLENAPVVPKDMKPPQNVLLVFSNSEGDSLLLSEMRGPGLPSPGPVKLPAGKGSVKDLTVNGQPAQYIEGVWTPEGWDSKGNHQLHWQGADGILYDLTSPSLGQKLLLRIAESIKE